MKKFGPVAVVGALVASFFAGQETAPEPAPAPAVVSPCPDGFVFSEISQDVASLTCSSDPYVVIINPDGSPVKAIDTSGRGEIPVSEVPGWFE